MAVCANGGSPASGTRCTSGTNVELDWEDHHYVEARYYQHRDELAVTINGASVLTESLAV